VFVGPEEWSVLPGELSKRMGNGGIRCNEAPVEVAESKEGSDFKQVGWRRPVQDALHFLDVHGNPISSDNEAKEFHAVLVELAFLGFGEESCFAKCFKDRGNMLIVFLQCVRVDEDVIQVTDDIVIQHHPEVVVHQVLE
jgi:hypothetical protein